MNKDFKGRQNPVSKSHSKFTQILDELNKLLDTQSVKPRKAYPPYKKATKYNESHLDCFTIG